MESFGSGQFAYKFLSKILEYSWKMTGLFGWMIALCSSMNYFQSIYSIDLDVAPVYPIRGCFRIISSDREKKLVEHIKEVIFQMKP